MLASNVNNLSLTDFASPADPSLGSGVAFPIYAATGAAATAVVYFEVAPGKRLGRHTDSSEEVIYVVEGTGEVTIGDEYAMVSTGTLAVVPALVPHDVRNTGSNPLKVVGFFAGSALMYAFFEPILPGADVTIAVHDQTGESLMAGTPFVPAMAGGAGSAKISLVPREEGNLGHASRSLPSALQTTYGGLTPLLLGGPDPFEHA